jgi:hypothetical protein
MTGNHLWGFYSGRAITAPLSREDNSSDLRPKLPRKSVKIKRAPFLGFPYQKRTTIRMFMLGYYSQIGSDRTSRNFNVQKNTRDPLVISLRSAPSRAYTKGQPPLLHLFLK